MSAMKRLYMQLVEIADDKEEEDLIMEIANKALTVGIGRYQEAFNKVMSTLTRGDDNDSTGHKDK